MTYDEFMNIISESDVDDCIYDDSDGRYIYKNDIAITMQRDREDQTDFEEVWVERFIHHPTATRLMVYLRYMGTTIDIFYTASVDEARMNIPHPKLEDMTISRQQYNIGRIVNLIECQVINRYDEYLQIVEITVRE
jgi:hypothetical protein